MVLNKRRSSATAKKTNLVVDKNPESIISEQFRTIRTNIHFLKGDKKESILLITSPGKGEGKSTIAANIAVSMTQQKENILLIDGNLRNPSVHSLFKLSNTSGLSDVLTGKITFEEAVISTGIGNLDIITSGTKPFNPAELLASPMMKEFLQTVSPSYDTVLIDSPPLLEVTDTKIMANLCDGVVLVVKKTKTNSESAYQSKKVLGFAKAQIIGVILNE
ncbi:polysaccharide biosynthesis tyrosine autokinase [Siminovitchia acidinfaciens]|uniref:non-specific protein-tyrosine kinase n=1 Tax=Siminovitchia acidinfaciens TaxID=2321395 RepID=A0A429XW00_9BACI|nr:CpsD/CapB family tyrosine-protein kinase [Siminovitchia acidinfaciens]RST72541.1 polysaccharide biosynthesis tyrosine autokinase [Siminovitchia acidinfaciens]